MPTPRVDKQLVDQLDAYFQRRKERQFAWKSVVSTFLALPGLRGLWTMGSVGYSATGRARDVSGNDNDLDDVGTVDFGRDVLVPLADFNGTTQALRKADGGAANWADVTGTEGYILPADNGLGLIAWVYSDRAAASEYLISKHGGVQNSYFMANINTGVVRFYIDDDGTGATPAQVDSVKTRTAGRWALVAGSFDPGASVDVWLADVDGYEHTSAVTAIASIFDGTANFSVASSPAGTLFFQGCMCCVALCAARFDDLLVRSVFETTRAAFGA